MESSPLEPAKRASRRGDVAQSPRRPSWGCKRGENKPAKRATENLFRLPRTFPVDRGRHFMQELAAEGLEFESVKSRGRG